MRYHEELYNRRYLSIVAHGFAHLILDFEFFAKIAEIATKEQDTKN